MSINILNVQYLHLFHRHLWGSDMDPPLQKMRNNIMNRIIQTVSCIHYQQKIDKSASRGSLVFLPIVSLKLCCTTRAADNGSSEWKLCVTAGIKKGLQGRIHMKMSLWFPLKSRLWSLKRGRLNSSIWRPEVDMDAGVHPIHQAPVESCFN